MGFSHGLFMMILRVIPMFCFEILEKNSRSVKLENLGIIGLLRHSVGNPCCGVDLRQGVGYPRRGEAEVPKWHPSGMPRRSKATPLRRPMPQHSSTTPRRSYCSL